MNILMLLKMKDQVEVLYADFTLRQALEKMRAHKYTAIPVLDRSSGKYLETLSNGDLLFYIAEHYLSFDDLENIPLTDIIPYRSAKAVSIDTSIDEVYHMIMEENFVPVVDSRSVFIGIVTRKSVLNCLLETKTEEK